MHKPATYTNRYQITVSSDGATIVFGTVNFDTKQDDAHTGVFLSVADAEGLASMLKTTIEQHRMKAGIADVGGNVKPIK